jgi:flagellar basal-body rod protein FlgG
MYNMRALWTAATGMAGQQMNVDVIANNLSNVNTTSYKKSRVEFKDLIYENMNKAYNLEEKTDKPSGLQVGLGAKPTATLKDFKNGNIEQTENPTDFAIKGEGFFTLKNSQGDIVYTKDGSFKLSPTDDGIMLTNAQGFPVLDSSGNEIILEINDPSKLTVDQYGKFMIYNSEGILEDTDYSLGVVRFQNPSGLENIGNNNYSATGASGQPVWENELEEGSERSIVMQEYLESSNVELIEEMVKLIVAQRAYEINSKTVQAADDMMQQANNLKR